MPVVLAALVLGPAGPAHADDDDGGDRGRDNIVEVVNTTDGSRLFDLAFQIRHVADGVVDHTNAAVAYASCEQCQTVALAFQIILVDTPPDVLTPTNVAVAINENCDTCETFAGAYQFVVGGSGRLRFTGEGRARLAALQERLRALDSPDLGVDAVRAEVDAVVAELRDILASHLVRAGEDEDEDDGDDGGEDAEGGDEDGDDGGDDGPATTTTSSPATTTSTTTTTAPGGATTTTELRSDTTSTTAKGATTTTRAG